MNDGDYVPSSEPSSEDETAKKSPSISVAPTKRKPRRKRRRNAAFTTASPSATSNNKSTFPSHNHAILDSNVNILAPHRDMMMVDQLQDSCDEMQTPPPKKAKIHRTKKKPKKRTKKAKKRTKKNSNDSDLEYMDSDDDVVDMTKMGVRKKMDLVRNHLASGEAVVQAANNCVTISRRMAFYLRDPEGVSAILNSLLAVKSKKARLFQKTMDDQVVGSFTKRWTMEETTVLLGAVRFVDAHGQLTRYDRTYQPTSSANVRIILRIYNILVTKEEFDILWINKFSARGVKSVKDKINRIAKKTQGSDNELCVKLRRVIMRLGWKPSKVNSLKCPGSVEECLENSNHLELQQDYKRLYRKVKSGKQNVLDRLGDLLEKGLGMTALQAKEAAPSPAPSQPVAPPSQAVAPSSNNALIKSPDRGAGVTQFILNVSNDPVIPDAMKTRICDNLFGGSMAVEMKRKIELMMNNNLSLHEIVFTLNHQIQDEYKEDQI
eukprot:717340_1